MEKLIIAVDGTSSSGKSVIFKKVARILNYQFVDTGLMYRAFTWYCLSKNIDINNQDQIIKLLDSFDYKISNDQVFVNNTNVTNKLTSSEILNTINKITIIPQIRNYMVKAQQQMVKNKGYILVGRDITSVVLPNADLKIYLDCDIEIRAKRRFEQNVENKILDKSFKQIYQDLIKRDQVDKTRKIGPLVLVSDAWYIDNSYLTIDQVVDIVVNKVHQLESQK
ncbi:(d)CMP kinase [Mycoplasma capricolum subsp. capripneumoniae]|uniref:Cytidylate kinase n=1 Tax=Mycoplasma capricolum subsp. capripneumoniae 87001 TaxID=1124992 RepID=A0A9N7BJN9_MYCCC|nr:(d)CMP kinase [Mycoplasma capricolum]AJK51600.1 cytidylate kinase [Mycoplasma capricolum subsp. capripneumoniae 87001]AOQ22249.1 cytidylate kinase [Mycoplasma capricolum subsp. capripneumoniae M1601]AQU77594.1 cytidylate kinase [Mycoplasma capricolum subsp. capripneumoniae]KEY84587.1 Cytidylate kinase [Mycoplasma capricolum subsp. capripneumoniae 99108]QDL19714.1 cytidylate kinase [Mycoplasma capricolum subsp. capripneumoniae]